MMYSARCNSTDVNTCKRILFANRASVENILPTSTALRQHILQAVLQVTNWYRCFEKQRIELDPSNWGWENVDSKYLPFWSELAAAFSAYRELIKFSCKKSCRGRCKCFQQELKCTELCSCLGNAQTNIKGAAMQNRKPEINDRINLKTQIVILCSVS